MISSLYLHSVSAAKPLRIGVLVDSFELSPAFRQVLTDIQSSNFARLELAVVNCEPSVSGPALPQNPLLRHLRLASNSTYRKHFLYSLYQKFDQRHIQHPDPLEPVDCSDLLTPLPRLDVIPITRKFVHRFPPEALDALRGYDLDVLLRFGFNILRGDVLTAARYGIWSFHHGDNDFYRGGPAGFWEVFEDKPCSGVILQVLTETLDDGRVLCKSLFATSRGLSRNRNIFYPYWGSTHFVIRKLHELHSAGWESLQRTMIPPAPYQGKEKIYRTPGNAPMLRWLGPKIAPQLLRPLRPKVELHWRICLRRSESPRMLSDRTSKWSDFQWMPSPRGHFYADPFLFEHQGQAWIFFEDYLYAEGRGRILCAPLRPDLSTGAPTVCLDLPYHLSYPCVFEENGNIYMLPESAANDSVDLYRAVDFPSRWELEKRLFQASAVDTTPLFHEGRWYFFTTLCEPPGNGAFGALFSADSLTCEWTPHPSSPISTDVRYARSGGAIHKIDGRLLRPVQDCSELYGRRIHIHEILELSPAVYRDRRLHSIEPDWENNLAGTHTYAFCPGFEAIDAVHVEKRGNIMP